MENKMTNFKTVSAFVIGGLAVLFAFQNTASVPVSFLFWNVEAPRVFILLLTFVFGGIAGMLLAHSMQKKAIKKVESKQETD